MSHKNYSCIDLFPVTEAEMKEARKQLKASAKKVALQKTFSKEFAEGVALWETIVAKDKHRSMEKQEFTLCKRCVVECPDNELPSLESQ
jgi:hypothetical protein